MTLISKQSNEIQEANTRTGFLQVKDPVGLVSVGGEASRSVTIPHLATLANWLDVLPNVRAHESKRSQRIRIPHSGIRNRATEIVLCDAVVVVVECSMFGVLMMPSWNKKGSSHGQGRNDPTPQG